jgi:hypothetical protein
MAKGSMSEEAISLACLRSYLLLVCLHCTAICVLHCHSLPCLGPIGPTSAMHPSWPVYLLLTWLLSYRGAAREMSRCARRFVSAAGWLRGAPQQPARAPPSLRFKVFLLCTYQKRRKQQQLPLWTWRAARPHQRTRRKVLPTRSPPDIYHVPREPTHWKGSRGMILCASGDLGDHSPGDVSLSGL